MEVRARIVSQVAEAVTESAAPGSQDLTGDALRQVLDARAGGDPYVLRAAVMELAVRASLWCVAIDIRHPDPAFAKMQRRTPGPGRRD